MEIEEHGFGERHEPVYLLSLDGGGVRGISEAVILHEIMTRIQKELGVKTLPKPCDYFHLIGGTSTGGLIAIMLGRLRMSTQEVLDEYENIASEIFNKKNRRLDKSFKEGKLEEAIKAVVNPRVIDGNTRMTDEEDIHKGLCFVVSLKKGVDDNAPSIFRSYKCLGEEETKCQIWEAARATTAAPGFFKPARIKVGTEDEFFIDGAVRWNNPSWHVLKEAAARFGSPSRRLGCLVSLGTGLRPPSLDKNGHGDRKWFRPSYKVSELAKLALNSLTDPEPPHRDIQARFQKHPDSYFRFSVPYTSNEERVRIHEHDKMDILRRNTEKYLAVKDVSNKIDEIVDILCRQRTTDLTLDSAYYASTPETIAEAMGPLVKEPKVTSAHFTGREDILSVLDSIFARRKPGSSPRRDFGLWGVGGVGKTQIALRFIDHFAERFDRIFWVDASHVQMIHHSFETIASDVLKQPGQPPHTRAVLDWLDTTKEEWFLVIDNCDSVDMTPYLPGNRKGNMLFTSRRQNLQPQLPRGSMWQVSEMNRTDSARLLLRACRLDEGDEEVLQQTYPLVDELGGLPLALDTAGARIYMGGQTFDQYLFNLREQRSKVLAEAPPDSEVSKNPSTYATFELSFKSIKSYARGSSEKARLSRSALQILNTFCFYHSESIPAEIIVRACLGINLTKRWDEVGLSAQPEPGPDGRMFLGMRGGSEPVDCDYLMGGITLLLRFSLLKMPRKTPLYSIHPLVHSWLRDRMHPGRFDQNLKLSRSVLYHSYHQRIQNSEAEKFYPCLLPHMKANNSHQFKREDTTPFWVQMEVRWKYVQVLKRSRLWNEAIPLIEKDIESWIFETDRNHWQTLRVMVELAEAYMATGRIVEAEGILHQVYERASYCPSLTWAKRCFVHVYGELAMAYLVEGDFGPAQLAAESGFRYGKTRGIDSLTVTARLCLVYQYVEKWEAALVLANTVLNTRLQNKRQGPTHHATMKAEAEVACIRARLGEVDEAEKVLVRIAQKFETELGKLHYNTLVVRTNLAWVYFTQHRYGDAEVIQREVLKTGRSVLGSDHLYTLYMMLRLGLTLGESGKYQEAIDVLAECEAGRMKKLWGFHPAVIGAAVWGTMFLCRRNGDDYRTGISAAQVKKLEQGMRYAEHPYTPVQI